PKNPKISPSSTWKLTWSTATSSPKRRLRSVTSIAGISISVLAAEGASGVIARDDRARLEGMDQQVERVEQDAFVQLGIARPTQSATHHMAQRVERAWHPRLRGLVRLRGDDHGRNRLHLDGPLDRTDRAMAQTSSPRHHDDVGSQLGDLGRQLDRGLITKVAQLAGESGRKMSFGQPANAMLMGQRAQ